jgi:hypothetical protein
MLPLELGEPDCKSISLPVDRKYQKEKSRDNYINSLFNLIGRINTIILIFKVYVYSAQNWGKAELIPVLSLIYISFIF